MSTLTFQQRHRMGVVLAWLAVAIVAVVIVLSRFSTSVDLSYFLPAAQTAEETVLIDRLGQGPGSRLWFIHLPAGFSESAGQGSNAFKQDLIATGLFASVINGSDELAPDAIPDAVFDNRYLLEDVDVSAAGIRTALTNRLPDLTFSPGPEWEAFFFADPYLASVAVMETGVAPLQATAPVWLDAAGGAYLVAETIAPAYDTEAQITVAGTLQRVAVERFGVAAESSGVGAYAADIQQTIRAEATARSALATGAIFAVLMFMYRSALLTVLGAVPLLLGVVAALAAVTLIFGEVHGITLAFGFTLFGVAIDYPLHVLSHRRAGDSVASIWPVMRLGCLSTVLAYCALAGAGSAGLAQLGVFSAVGVLVALLASITFLPAVAPRTVPAGLKATQPVASFELRHTIWMLLLLVSGGGLLLQSGNDLFSDDLAALTPLPRDTLERDAALRREFGAPEIRYLILVTGPAAEAVLVTTEQLVDDLRSAPDSVAGVQSVTDLVPSRKTQARRRAALRVFRPEFLQDAAAQLGFTADSFDALRAALETAPQRADITVDTYRGSQLAPLVESKLYQRQGTWSSLVTLGRIDNLHAVTETIAQYPGARLVDLKAASVSLVGRYRQEVLLLLAGAFAVVAGVLWWQVRTLRRWLWIVGSLAGTVLVTVLLTALVFGSVSLFSLIATVLVAGLGFDYLLFLSRGSDADSAISAASIANSRHAILASFLSTAAAFAILGASAVPILASLGFTVLTGVVTAFLLGRFGLARR